MTDSSETESRTRPRHRRSTPSLPGVRKRVRALVNRHPTLVFVVFAVAAWLSLCALFGLPPSVAWLLSLTSRT